MIALTCAASLVLAALPLAGPPPLALDPPRLGALGRPRLTLAPNPSLLPEPPADRLAAPLGEELASEQKSDLPGQTGMSRRKSGVTLLVSSLLALGASFAVMPLADAVAPNDSPNQGAMVLKLELVVYSAGAALVGGYLLVSSPAEKR